MLLQEQSSDYDFSTTNDSSFQFSDASFQQMPRPGRQAALNAPPGPSGNFGRPLSSADETGPDRKKLRAEVPRPAEESSKRVRPKPPSVTCFIA